MFAHIARFPALACAAALAVLGAPAWAADPATITLPVTVDSLQWRQVRYALEQVYTSLNIKLRFVARPPLRALVEADSGALDGDVIRPNMIESSYPNLRRVDVPLYMNVASAVVRKESGAAPASLEEVRKRKSVGIVRGIRHAQAATQGWTNVVVVNNYPSAMRMLSQGLVEVVLGGDGTIREAISDGHLDVARFNIQTVYQTPLYHYLHKRHAGMLPQVQAGLAKLKGDKATVLDGLLASGRADLPR